MKKISLLLAGIGIFAFSSCNKEEILTQEQVPEEINTYVRTHFSSNTILGCVKDEGVFQTDYSVSLSDAIFLNFDGELEITRIDANVELPESVIPAKIRAYVEDEYSTNYITDWEQEKKNQQVQLDNDLRLEFDEDGKFLRIDN